MNPIKEEQTHGKMWCLWQRYCFRNQGFSFSQTCEQNLEAQHSSGKGDCKRQPQAYLRLHPLLAFRQGYPCRLNWTEEFKGVLSGAPFSLPDFEAKKQQLKLSRTILPIHCQSFLFHESEAVQNRSFQLLFCRLCRIQAQCFFTLSFFSVPARRRSIFPRCFQTSKPPRKRAAAMLSMQYRGVPILYIRKSTI